jgi:signal transduction histidine kinase
VIETLRVLVIDDEAGMQLGASRALRDFEIEVADVGVKVAFEVASAGTGEEGLKKIEAEPPHILLLDHKLPGLSGLDVLERLSERGLETLTVMITAYASLETAVEATKRGAYDFLAKPFTPAELRNVVRKAAVRLMLARQARRLAEEKRQVRFEFISVLAHELKSPLAAVEGYLGLIRDRVAGEELSAYDQMVERSLVRMEGMRKLILDLLDMTRIESGRKKRDLTDVDAAELARAAIDETFAPAAAEREIAIELHVTGPTDLRADRGEVEIILNNLISNAVKYNRDGGRVDVTLTGDDERLTIEVADTGIGMSEEEAAKLFGDFVRIKNERTRNIQGSGLGLSIVKKLAALYDGDVGVHSVPDEGSTFTVTLGRHIQPADAGDGGPTDARPAAE